MQTRFRSPYTLSIRPTVGQNLVEELTHGAGKAEEELDCNIRVDYKMDVMVTVKSCCTRKIKCRMEEG